VEDRNTSGGHNLTCWLTGRWSTQAKVERTVLKAAWHWGSDSSIVNNPFGEPGRTLLYAGLLFKWGSINGDLMFYPFSWEGLISRDSDGYKWMNKPWAVEMEHFYPQEPCWRTRRGAYLPGTLRESELLGVSIHRKL